MMNIENGLNSMIINIIYLIINVITFVVFGLDKFYAIKKKWRYKVTTLLGLCFIGGALGGFLAMKIFNHKTNKNIFTISVPLLLVVQIAILLFIQYNL